MPSNDLEKLLDSYSYREIKGLWFCLSTTAWHVPTLCYTHELGIQSKRSLVHLVCNNCCHQEWFILRSQILS